MVLKLYITHSEREEGFGPLEVLANVSNGKLKINDNEINFKNYMLIGGPEIREGDYPALKVIYKFNDYEGRKEDARKIRGVSELKIKELDEPERISGMPFLDLIFPKGTRIISANQDVPEIK